MGNGLAVGNCMQQKMEVKQNSENVDLLKTCFNITFFAYQKTCLGSSSFPSTLPIGFHDSHHFAPDVGPITASIYSIQVLFSPSLLAQYNLRTRNDATGTKEIFTHTVDWNSSHQPYGFWGGKVGIQFLHPPSFSHQETEPTIPGSLHPQKWSFYLPSSLRSQPLPWVPRYARNLKQATSDSLSTLELKIMVLCSNMCSKCCRLQLYSRPNFQ